MKRMETACRLRDLGDKEVKPNLLKIKYKYMYTTGHPGKSIEPETSYCISSKISVKNILLKKLNLESVTVIALKEFEDDALLRIKNIRSAGEYCWTCTPSIIKFAIEVYALQSCTYLDADLYFFANPSILIEEQMAVTPLCRKKNSSG